MPLALQRQDAVFADGGGLQPHFHHLLLTLNGPAQLLLTHLIVGFL